MNKLLLLGSVASPCPPVKQGGTERVAYYQGKQLAKRGIPIIFVGGKGTKTNFANQLELEKEMAMSSILSRINFVEIGGDTQAGNAQDAREDDQMVESSRKMRLELVYLTQIVELMKSRAHEYSCILNNTRGGESILLPYAKDLNKPFFTVMHINIFPELAKLFQKYDTRIITIGDHQRQSFPGLNYAATIYNPMNTKVFEFNDEPQDYALMMSTIGTHKNQKDAILACQASGMSLIISGKIRDRDYFDHEIKPYINNKLVQYYGELDFEAKLEVYKNAKVFLFPIAWQEPFGLVLIEALACGTPVISYPHGGPQEIIKNDKTGFLVNTVDEMAEKLKKIDKIDRHACREDVVKRFDEAVIGEQYYNVIKPFIN